jgi:hypothetical protein
VPRPRREAVTPSQMLGTQAADGSHDGSRAVKASRRHCRITPIAVTGPAWLPFPSKRERWGRLPADPLVVSSRGRGLVALCGGRRREDRLARAEYAPAEHVQLA